MSELNTAIAPVGLAAWIARARPRLPVLRALIGGLVTPIRHPLALLCSIPWFLATIAINARVSTHRRWLDGMGFGSSWGYDYDWTWYGLLLIQGACLVGFLVIWVQVNSGIARPLKAVTRERVASRLLRIAVAAIKIAFLLVVGGALWLAIPNLFYKIDPDSFYRDVLPPLTWMLLVVSLWIACRLAPMLSAAFDDDGWVGVRAAWARTRGQALWIFAALAPAPLLIAALKWHLLQGYEHTIRTTFRWLIFDTHPLWKFPWDVDPVPLSLVVTSAAIVWLQCVWVFATLAILFRRTAVLPR